MELSDKDRFRKLVAKHHKLYSDWKYNKGPCIICGENEGKDKDHLPPEVLFPKILRDDKTEFLTFPVCQGCNNGSSDNDFLVSVKMCVSLNQESYLNEGEPTDPDLLALHEQMQSHLQDPEKGGHRLKLLRPYVDNGKINIDRLPVNRTITKIVKSIYWLHTEGDILQRYNPGWWILSDIDTSKKNFIEKHLMTTKAEIQWNDRFITHYSDVRPEEGVGGFFSCSLHFYTKRAVGAGMSWFAVAAPVDAQIDDGNLFDLTHNALGEPTIPPATN